MTVFIERNKGEMVGRDGELWLVDTGKAIIKSKYEPVTHKFSEGWYVKDRKPVLVKPYTAWAREGVLVPIYQYYDYSRPPFGSNCLYESELEKLEATGCPYLSDEEVDRISDEHYAAIRPLREALKAATEAVSAAERAKRDALKLCMHDWQKSGDEESTGGNFLGQGCTQLWECAKCGTEYTSHYTKLG